MTTLQKWQVIAHAGTQIQLLTDMRDAGELEFCEWKIEVEKIMDEIETI